MLEGIIKFPPARSSVIYVPRAVEVSVRTRRVREGDFAMYLELRTRGKGMKGFCDVWINKHLDCDRR